MPIGRVTIAASLIGALLTWLELWYGSTFYYGEVRDKQNLPFGINNGGALGSVVFLTYIISRIRPTQWSRRRLVLFRAVAVFALILGHVAVLRLLEAPWQLAQS